LLGEAQQAGCCRAPRGSMSPIPAVASGGRCSLVVEIFIESRSALLLLGPALGSWIEASRFSCAAVRPCGRSAAAPQTVGWRLRPCQPLPARAALAVQRVEVKAQDRDDSFRWHQFGQQSRMHGESVRERVQAFDLERGLRAELGPTGRGQGL
jgi:hypothetical protein